MKAKSTTIPPTFILSGNPFVFPCLPTEVYGQIIKNIVE